MDLTTLLPSPSPPIFNFDHVKQFIFDTCDWDYQNEVCQEKKKLIQVETTEANTVLKPNYH